jgi:hypothetical protein
LREGRTWDSVPRETQRDIRTRNPVLCDSSFIVKNPEENMSFWIRP